MDAIVDTKEQDKRVPSDGEEGREWAWGLCWGCLWMSEAEKPFRYACEDVDIQREEEEIFLPKRGLVILSTQDL